MTEVLSQRGLNRATLARQHPLERAPARAIEAIERQPPVQGHVTSDGSAAALFRDLGEEQPGARDAASRSYEYRPDQDVESRVHTEDQAGACSQQQQRSARGRSNSLEYGHDRLITPLAPRTSVQDVEARASDDGESDQLGAERAVRLPGNRDQDRDNKNCADASVQLSVVTDGDFRRSWGALCQKLLSSEELDYDVDASHDLLNASWLTR